MWNLKHDTSELTYKTETDSQTQRTELCVPRGSGWGEDELEFMVSRCKLLFKGWMSHRSHCTAQGTYSVSCNKP